MKNVANVMVLATLAGALTFVITYARLAPWRSTPVGRNVMSLMAVIVIVSTLAAANLLFGLDWPYRDTIRALSWGSIAAIIWRRVALVVRAQTLPGRHEQRSLVAVRPVVAAPPAEPSQVAADARNRAFRTFVQGLGVDLAVAVVLALAASAGDLAWTRAYWATVGTLLAKTALTTAAAYVMRIYAPPAR
ncbi:hypothetical protein ACTOB_001261 [Actinoplanes oblitus]|uniref:Uncharacterized protein n=1 Tax=Actinoplanes oblitus TaxID=3040509 RepID=A0ABY8WKV8_9ACTN|nr:hypothetical protein [Actinoplanes oblitus]WIM97713.1 hypothetical protein ACTOB_001261 [Actinoplanes oblitus]